MVTDATATLARDGTVITMPDTGCPDHLFRSCLKCPLSRCRFDLDPVVFKTALQSARRRLAGEVAR